ncbi:MAG: efflux RND transporter periplasmic adaptor subunit [Myxococcaceae bacterium]
MNRGLLPLTLSLAIVLTACGGSDASKPKASDAGVAPLKVSTTPVQVLPMPKYLTLTGSVNADKQSEVAANVAGRVTATYVERGEPVKRGLALALVDAKAAGYQAMAANAQSRAADTQVQVAQQDCARADALFAQGAIAKSDYERQKAQCTSQLYNANAARAQADLAGKLAGDTVIRAPIDGIIGERYVSVGEYVTPSAKVASVFSVTPVRINISVPESVVSQVHAGQKLNVRVSAYPGRDFPAEVRFVSPALRPNTRDLIVEAFADNTDLALRPGMFATVLLHVGDAEQPTVPLEAIRTDGTVRRMFLAREGNAFEMVVRIGVEKDGRVAVLESLSAADNVIVKPPPGLRDGTSIQ